ncbi:MAG: nitroreductase family protein [Ktedonobacterales bacterium]
MNYDELLELMQDRQSARIPFDQARPVPDGDLRRILEAARWAPSAHNMQNFQIVAVDDPMVLEKIGAIPSRISDVFLRENYQQLSFTEAELLQKKVGLLATMFPPSWRDPDRLEETVRESESQPAPLRQTLQSSPLLLIALSDASKRAPASEGDVLGIMSLGCLMENMWLMAQALGIGFQIMSVFSAPVVEAEVKGLLAIPDYFKIAFAARLGYPSSSAPLHYLRIRRDVEVFTSRNKFGNREWGEHPLATPTP